MEQLVSASIGLYNCKGQHYLQIIPNESEQHIFIKISQQQAEALSSENDVEIAEALDVPRFRTLND